MRWPWEAKPSTTNSDTAVDQLEVVTVAVQKAANELRTIVADLRETDLEDIK